MRNARTGSSRLVIFVAGLLWTLAATSAFAGSSPTDPNRYLNAVREFADNVLKYGRDTYGPKHTPLFVDGLNIHTHEPVKWINPDGTRWILSNLASQQNLFRTLDGLTKITGDPKYKQAAIDAVRYAFANLRSPNGLLYWGEHSAYDASADRVVYSGQMHSFKSFYPSYELMWETDPIATKRFIESFWAVHILDWSNLDMNRYGPLDRLSVPIGWEHEYSRTPVFFAGNGNSMDSTGSDLYYAACVLSKLTGDKKPLVWAKRLAYRYVETRDPNTGMGGAAYTRLMPLAAMRLPEDFPGHVLQEGTIFYEKGKGDPSQLPLYLHGYIYSPGVVGNWVCYPSICQLLIAELLGGEGQGFRQWALEELTARGRRAYRRSDGSWVPMFTDGTSLEGYVSKNDISGLIQKGETFRAWKTDTTDFWGYALAYSMTGDGFMWEMTRDIARANNLGDIGADSNAGAVLNLTTTCDNAHALLGFLRLYAKTKSSSFGDMAARIGENILTTRFHRGFFVPSSRHTYASLNAVESLALLHLHNVLTPSRLQLPQVWPSRPRFSAPYRRKGEVYDNLLIYTLTDAAEPPVSLNEAAAMGNMELVKSLVAQGTRLNEPETGALVTPLHDAVKAGHKDAAEFLLLKGADLSARANWRGETPLHYAAALKTGKDMAALLIGKGADVNAESNSGDTPLQYAAYNDNKDIIELLVEKGATVCNLHLAAYMGDLAKAESLIQEGKDVNALDGHGHAPLHYAAGNDQKQAVELLLTKGADINVRNWGGQTPLDIASSQNRQDIVELLLAKGAEVSIHTAVDLGSVDKVRSLLEKGADVDARDKRGATPLHLAANKAVAELLLAKGADVSTKNKNGQTPLHAAASNKRKEVAKLLISKGADANAKDNRNYTPLFYALFNNDVNMVGLLAGKGGDVGYSPEKGYPPLYFGVWFENKDMVALLLDHGARFDVKDPDGWTPLRHAASRGNRDIVDLFIAKGADVSGLPMAACAGNLARVKELVEQGADLNAEDELGWTPLYWAASMGREEVATFLIDRGAQVDTRTNDEQTALQQAAQAGATRLVELLISKGADVKAGDKNGKTPLHVAASVGRREVVELLLAKGADVDAKTTNGWTPLHMAVLAGRKEAVEGLVGKGVDVNAKDKQGRTPLKCAEQRGHKEIAELLRKHGARE